MTGALGRNDDRQVRDWHPLAVEDQTLGRVSAGRTSEGVTLNAAYRRPIGANFRQEHLGAARQTFHICRGPPVADTLMKPTLCPQRGGTLPLWVAARKGLGAGPLQGPSDLAYRSSWDRNWRATRPTGRSSRILEHRRWGEGR